MATRGDEGATAPQRRRVAGERRQLTVLFTDLRGSTEIGRRLEVELFAELLAEVRARWHAAAERHGGVVVRTQGDGALIVFGWPEAREDDGRRAAEAALEIHDAVAALGREQELGDGALAVRSGLHAGIVYLTEGDLERGRLDLTGDVANTAAHLQADAPTNGVLASVAALGPHANLFELGPDPRAAAEGVEAVQVLRRGTAARRFDATAQRGLTPFIGRREALDFVERFLAGEARCAVIQAGPGLGKTRLLEEMAALPPLEGLQVLRGTCESFAAAEVLQPFAQMLRRRGLVPDAAQAPAQIAALAAERPTVLVIDDWQWADDASRQLLVALLRASEGPRVLLAARPRDDGADWIADAPHLTLRPFDALQTALAVRRWLPEADPFLAARIHDYAGGVPLYVEELCHSASADTLDQSLDARRSTKGWLGALVASRLARLPAPQAAVVRAAAVIGARVPRELLAGVCESAPSDRTLHLLAEADFLYPDERAGALRFKHGITRDAVYESIGLYERTALHQRIEAALLDSGDASDEALAHHARGAGHWERAALHGGRAGDRALAAFSMDSARRHYAAALEALDRAPQRGPEQERAWCALAAKLGMTCVFDPLSLPDGLAVFERALALARGLADAVLEARALYWLGYLEYAVGRFGDAAAHAREALAAAHALGDARLAAQIEAMLGQILAGTGEVGEALALMDRALDLKRAASRPGGSLAVGSAYTLGCKGSVLADQGEFAAAHAAFEQALQLLAGSTHPVGNSTRNWIAISWLWQGRWEEAQRVTAESARIATDTRALLLLACSRAVQGHARWCAGDDDGLDQLRESVRWLVARHGDFYVSLFHGWLAEAAAHTLDWTEARAAARLALRRAQAGERLGEASACRVLALRAAARGHAGTARGWLRRADASAQRRASAREAALNDLVRARVLDAPALHARAIEALRALGVARLPRDAATTA